MSSINGPTPTTCRSSTSNFTVQDGRIVSPYGWSLQNERITLRNQPKAAFAFTAGTGADFGVQLQYRDAVPATEFEVTPPATTDPNDRARVSGHATPNSFVEIHDGLGTLLNVGQVGTDADGNWSAVINGVLAVPVMVLLMLMANHRNVMGRFVIGGPLYWLGWLSTAAMALSVVAMGVGFFVGSR